ncbi:MAG: hypothetical protein QNJ98_17715 [Planctomycetota bacterium]|nr:hypothetical protein [Planctomycetota bacterium]
MRWVQGLVLLVLVGLGAPVGAADDPLVSGADAKALERVVQSLGRKGHPQAVEQLADVLRDLRVPDKLLKNIGKAKAKAEKAAKKPKDAKAEAKKLAQLATRLAKGLEARDEAARTHLAQVILRIDATEATAHEALGDVQRDGRWLPSWMPPLLDRRAEIAGFVTRAMHLEVPVETGTMDEPFLRALYGREANYAKGGGCLLTSCTWSQQSLKRIATQVARAKQLSRWILGKGDVPAGEPIQVRIVEKRDMYLKAFRLAKSQGVLEDYVAQISGELNSFFDRKWRFVLQTPLETGAMADIFHWVGRDQLDRLYGGFPQEPLTVGHMNWVSLSVFGVPANDTVYFDEETIAGSGGGRSIGKDPIPERRKRMVRLAKAGVRGLRSWLAYLTRMGAAPLWNEGFLADNARIQGDARVKCIYAAEYLHERRMLAKVMRGAHEADRNSPAAIQAAIEATLGASLDVFERRFRDWLLFKPGASGLVQRLGGGAETAAPLNQALQEAVQIVDQLRAQAFRGSAAIPKIIGDEELGRGCWLHAKFLTKHKDLWTEWPDVHEQTVDREGFTPEGNRGGLNSVIAFGCKGPKDAIDQWMGTFFHRLPLIQPGLVGIGWGIEDGIAVLDSGSLVEIESGSHYACWPPFDAKDVPLRFQPELPNPVPGEDQGTWGYPITMQQPQTDNLLAYEMALYKGGAATGEPVPCHFITPQAPKNPDLAPPNAWCLIPKQPLLPRTTYTVGVKDLTPGAKVPVWKWTFKTGGS